MFRDFWGNGKENFASQVNKKRIGDRILRYFQIKESKTDVNTLLQKLKTRKQIKTSPKLLQIQTKIKVRNATS